ncbi:c-type cytochrome [Candidatus Protochlamydia phocaeensis]|uniref:c-type cytochrome n=1 Tax=Candidatus Protochlamydia phocaeensis TaxID=1414722 RepID=UPI0008388DFB|nr:c-type cytochrome [Candidatus Protochlamydia phocaeensis]
MQRADLYQIFLIASGVLVTALFGVFLYREIFPEYRIYQDDYLALEEFRTTYTKQPVPPFKTGVKQIVLEKENKGPPVIDRCTSCHVALQIPYFSPTKLAYDLNGNIVRDDEGRPVLTANEDYIWRKLDDKIAELKDEKVIQQLKSQGQEAEVKKRLAEAEKYESLKTAHVGDQVYDVTKVLAMHPLMGHETRPFEYHPIEEYGCTSCHNGNGRGLTTNKAHGPVFDGQYEGEYRGPTPQFTESDPENDPRFAHVFNEKPGHELLFQTEPLFVGALIQAKCMQCHQTSERQLESAATSTSDLAQQRQKRLQVLLNAYNSDKQALSDLLRLQKVIQDKGYEGLMKELKEKLTDYTLPPSTLEHVSSQINYLEKAIKNQPDEDKRRKLASERINQDLIALLGSEGLVRSIEQAYDQKGEEAIDAFLRQHQKDPQAKGTLFDKGEALDLNQDLIQHAQDTAQSFETAVGDQKVLSALMSDVDELTRNYQRGKDLYMSQACYACHRISGFARGGVGPELTRIGESYPWYIKESIVWPQADLKTSTMPNMRLDHEEIEDLMTFLLAQRGGNRAVSQTSQQAYLQAWEAGRKMNWEKPVPPAKMHDLRYAMTVFATQGCASCHRLQGFDSNIGFKGEKDSSDFNEELYRQQEWFKRLFPEVIHLTTYDEQLPGSEIVNQIEKHAAEIDKYIVDNVRQNGILEEINKEHPEVVESLYSNFRYASRAKNHYYETLIEKESDPSKIAQLKAEHQAWQDRVHRVLMTYIQVYGLGRLIGPHLNWSGIYRTDEWLMEHFRNPSAHVPRSIMPVMPFDDTKFYALTYMLDELGIRNRNAVRQIWSLQGFNPQEAYDMHCAQCHGIAMQGNGVIAEWIYPIPKNLHNSDFLRNLTKEQAIYSITHGVHGTPMPPWGEIAQDKPQDIQKAGKKTPVLTAAEIRYLVDWLFSSLPGGEVMRELEGVPKWHYQPHDVLKELKDEGGHLIPLPEKSRKSLQEKELLPEKNLPEENNPPPSDASAISFLPTGEGYYASIRPEVYPRTAPQNVQQENKVEDVFDVLPNQQMPGGYSYYIKKKYYTPHNIQEGQKFFLLNCAVCHGNEADGSGIRGQAMQDAKPRMLTNLDWIESRDDMRLLRSIKYGVPGTSMTPWGDFTNSLQRLQLVMFIRTLSEEHDKRNGLEQALYQTYENDQMAIEDARIGISKQLRSAELESKEVEEKQTGIERRITEGKVDPQEAIKLYERHLEIERKINLLQECDKKLQELKSEVKRERELYFNLGVALITAKGISDDTVNRFLGLIRLNANRYSSDDQKLTLSHDPKTDQEIRKARKAIEQELNDQVAALERQRLVLQGKIHSAERTEELATNQAEIESIKKLKAKLIADTEEALRSIAKQESLLQEFNKLEKSEPQQNKSNEAGQLKKANDGQSNREQAPHSAKNQ